MSIIDFTLRSTKNWSNHEKALSFADILISENDFVLPQKMDNREPERYPFDKDNLSKYYELWHSDIGWLNLKRRKPYTAWMILQIKNSCSSKPRFNELNGGFDEKYFKNQVNISKFLTFMKKVFAWGHSEHAYACHHEDWDAKNYFGSPTLVTGGKTTSTGGIDLRDSLPGLYWANLFGTTYVDFIGRERFSTTPAFHKEELPDGGYLLITSPSPLDYRKDEVRKLEQGIIDHLGSDAFFEKAFPLKPLRAPLFIFDESPCTEHARSVALDPIKFCIGDSSKFIKEAASLAAALVHRLHGKVNYSVSSLEQVDEYISKEIHFTSEPWNNEEDCHILKELTAYYGEVLRQNLNGKWTIQAGSEGYEHPVVVISVASKPQNEYPFVRVLKLCIERVLDDGLMGRYRLIESGQLSNVENFLNNIDKI